MMIIKRSILFLIFSLTLNSLVYAKNSCVVNGLDIQKTDNSSITIKVIDNGNCFMYKFDKTGDELYSLTTSNGMKVKLGEIDTDAYSRSKISAIVPREKVIYFRLNFNPSFTYKLLDGVTYISFTPPKNLIIIDNNPINLIEKIDCKRSIGIIDITTTAPIAFDYGMIKENIAYVDIDDAYISDQTEIIGSCKEDMTFFYISYPLSVRFLISNLNYINNIAYLLDSSLLTFSEILEQNTVYVTKISQELFDNKTVLNIGLSSGEVTAIIKKSAKEFVIEINENTSAIGSLPYQRRFTTGDVRSIGRQNIGKKDRFVVRIDSGNNINIINRDNGFTIETFKDSNVDDNISIINKRTTKSVKSKVNNKDNSTRIDNKSINGIDIKDNSSMVEIKVLEGIDAKDNRSMIDNKTIKNIQDKDNISAIDKIVIIEQSEKDGQ